ncbi:MAG: DUF3784 domain-containing protein [Defluviitaleaceae bacterium]|nr:DUF3784 domain-containing protein [Defluviitaleaceae bacterium]
MLIFTILMAGIAVLFTIIGIIWLKGGGIKMMSLWNLMSEKKRDKIDQKAFLRFNGMIMITIAFVCAISAVFTSFAFNWGYLPGFLAIILGGLLAVWSSYAKAFRKKDSDEKPLEDDPKKRKKSLVLLGIFVLITMLPMGWLFFEGTRPINSSFSTDSVTFSGFYGITVPFDEIAAIYLLEQSMEEIGSGNRRMAHATPGNLRGRFANGHLLVQNPDIGPTIRISRHTAGPMFISLSTPEATLELFEELYNAAQ